MTVEELPLFCTTKPLKYFFPSYLANRLLQRLCYPVSGVDVPGHLGQFIGPGRRLPLRPPPLRTALCWLQLGSRTDPLQHGGGQKGRRDFTVVGCSGGCEPGKSADEDQEVGRITPPPDFNGHAPAVVLHSWATGKENLNCRTLH